MNTKGPRKRIPDTYWPSRLDAAKAYLEDARNLIELASEGQNCNPILSLIPLCAIAYADCLTAKFGSLINQQDHAMAPRVLRDVLGNRLPNEQEKRLVRLIRRKDEANYGARRSTLPEARALFADLEIFEAWAQDLLDQCRAHAI